MNISDIKYLFFSYINNLFTTICEFKQLACIGKYESFLHCKKKSVELCILAICVIFHKRLKGI